MCSSLAKPRLWAVVNCPKKSITTSLTMLGSTIDDQDETLLSSTREEETKEELYTDDEEEAPTEHCTELLDEIEL